MATRFVIVRGSARNPEPVMMSKSKPRMQRVARFLSSHFRNSRIRVRNVKGYEDRSGRFHPVRGSEGYNGRLAGERPKRRAKKRGRR